MSKEIITLDTIRSSLNLEPGQTVLIITGDKEITVSNARIVDVGRFNITYTRTINNNCLTCTAAWTNVVARREIIYDCTHEDGKTPEERERDERLMRYFGIKGNDGVEFVKGKPEQLPEDIQELIASFAPPKKTRRDREHIRVR